MKKELWKDIEGYESIYQISNIGRVKSLNRYINTSTGRRKYKGRVLKTNIDTKGYSYVILCVLGKKKNGYIHRLIGDHFIKKISGKKYINHKDGVKTNNGITNLEWVTFTENIRHAYTLGLISPRGKAKGVSI